MRFLLPALAMATLVPAAVQAHEPAPPPAGTFHVAILGDRTGLAVPGTFERAVERVNGLRPDLVLMVGDLIEGYTEDAAEIEQEWREADAMVARLEAPFAMVPGNHDIGNEAMIAAWQRHRGPLWSSFVREGVLFLLLNSDDPPEPMPPVMARGFREMAARMRVDPKGAEAALAAASRPDPTDMAALKRIEHSRIGDEQLAFIRGALDAHRDVRWTVILLHKPAWREGNAAFGRVEEMLAGRPYTVIAGHLHEYSYERRHDRDYIVVGPSGALPPHPGFATRDQIGWLAFGNASPSFSVLGLDGVSALHDTPMVPAK